MDDIVRAAMAKWPNVPECYGWLALDRRGQWLLGGEVLRHGGLIEFIQRNYGHDAAGNWFFQNGPQRVYVDLAYTPLVARLTHDGELLTHTGQCIDDISRAWLDEEGSLLLQTAHGPALLDDRDLPALLDAIRGAAGGALSDEVLLGFYQGTQILAFDWRGRAIALSPIAGADLPARLGYIRTPSASG